jgi:hypothetical protein
VPVCPVRSLCFPGRWILPRPTPYGGTEAAHRTSFDYTAAHRSAHSGEAFCFCFCCESHHTATPFTSACTSCFSRSTVAQITRILAAKLVHIRLFTLSLINLLLLSSAITIILDSHRPRQNLSKSLPRRITNSLAHNEINRPSRYPNTELRISSSCKL